MQFDTTRLIRGPLHMDRGVTDGAARPKQRRHGASRDRLRHVTLRWSTLVNTTSWSSFETKICATRMIRAIAKFIECVYRYRRNSRKLMSRFLTAPASVSPPPAVVELDDDGRRLGAHGHRSDYARSAASKRHHIGRAVRCTAYRRLGLHTPCDTLEE